MIFLIFVFRVSWQDPQKGNNGEGYKMYSSPIPGSGVIVESILKIFKKLMKNKKMNEDDVYLKLIESLKFAFAQRAKLGDTFNNTFKDEIEKVCNRLKKYLRKSNHFESFYP